MPISTTSTTINAILKFAREGRAFTIPSPGTVSRTGPPGYLDPAIWLNGDMGPCEDVKITPEVDEYELMGGAPGGRVILDVIPTAKKLKIAWGVQQISPEILGMILGTQPLNSASTQANPLAGVPSARGWLKLAAYDAANVNKWNADIWGSLKVTEVEPWSGANIFKAKMEFTMVFNLANTFSAIA